MIDIVGGFNAVFAFFGQHISTMLLIGGLFAGFYFIYWFFRGKPEEEEETPFILTFMTYLGVLVGIILIGGSINAISIRGQAAYQYHLFTCVLALIVGIALVLRPIKDVPWAAIIGVIVGAIIVFVCATYLEFITEGFATIFGIDPYWILIVLFIVILVMTYMAFKMIEDLGKLLGKILSSRPTSFLIMVLCVVEAILAYFGLSIWIW